jgi:hypothetical protein
MQKELGVEEKEKTADRILKCANKLKISKKAVEEVAVLSNLVANVAGFDELPKTPDKFETLAAILERAAGIVEEYLPAVGLHEEVTEELIAAIPDTVAAAIADAILAYRTGANTLVIGWDRIPKDVLISNLTKARECTLTSESNRFPLCTVNCPKGKPHLVTMRGCDCDQWKRAGTSINPCKHMTRARFSDKSIATLLEDLGVGAKDKVKVPRSRVGVDMQRYKAEAVKDMPPDFMIADLRPRLAEIGQIKIGERSAERRVQKGDQDFLPPEKWDHFGVTTMEKDTDGRPLLDKEIMEKIGNNCQELDIMLCYDDPVLNMPTMYAYFSRTRRLCSGNGRVAQRFSNESGYQEVTCKPSECQYYREKKCKPYGRLSVILPIANRVGGVYVYRTTSLYTIQNILSSMAFLRSKWGTGGPLVGIPLKMRLIKTTAIPKELGFRTTFWVVNIEFKGTLGELKQVAGAELASRKELGIAVREVEQEERRMLVERLATEAEGEGAEAIADEFYPEEGKDAGT